MSAHVWTTSTLGHGESMCSRCGVTNREAAVLGELDRCDGIDEPSMTDPNFNLSLTSLNDSEIRQRIAIMAGVLAYRGDPAAVGVALTNIALALENEARRENYLKVSLDSILAEVADRHKVSLEEILDPDRAFKFPPASTARDEFCYLASHEFGLDGKPRWGWARIGKFLNGRNHSTIYIACQRHMTKVLNFSEDQRNFRRRKP